VLIPSIDLKGGEVVQLRQGREHVLSAGEPGPLARSFGLVGEVAVIDLDAALGTGSNAGLIEGVLDLARCRVGGGIRDVETARRWLDAGAAKVILGTAARPELLRELPRERVIAAVDARDGEVVTHGWTSGTGAKIAEKMRELAPFVGGFLVTFVEVEGTMRGLPIERAAGLREHAGDARLTVAGGIKSAAEVGELDRLGIDAQVGMAIYTGAVGVHECVAACLSSDRSDGLWPTVVCDERGIALGLAWSNAESLKVALAERRGVYWSRKRGLWRKGETSGQVQELVGVEMDCDRDCLRFRVKASGTGHWALGDAASGKRQAAFGGGAEAGEPRPSALGPAASVFCHTGTATCWGEARGLDGLERRLGEIARGGGDAGSYTKKLLADPSLLASKLSEEAGELNRAATRQEIVHEAGDVLYFTLVRLAKEGVPLAEIERALDKRGLKLARRGGGRKS
jgi:phosphoribosyl-ATP pyrophosphohydrolase/phosphoribosyl-AMP cyclohydrolase